MLRQGEALEMPKLKPDLRILGRTPQPLRSVRQSGFVKTVSAPSQPRVPAAAVPEPAGDVGPGGEYGAFETRWWRPERPDLKAEMVILGRSKAARLKVGRPQQHKDGGLAVAREWQAKEGATSLAERLRRLLQQRRAETPAQKPVAAMLKTQKIERGTPTVRAAARAALKPALLFPSANEPSGKPEPEPLELSRPSAALGAVAALQLDQVRPAGKGAEDRAATAEMTVAVAPERAAAANSQAGEPPSPQRLDIDIEPVEQAPAARTDRPAASRKFRLPFGLGRLFGT